MVYYRKYRSQTIAQLDSPKLREVLTSVLSAKEVPHAFLFTGPKGLGKTSTARIIAKVLNCTGKKRDGIEPCNECDQCLSITNGSNIDVLEIDGASNRGIDEIRELRERVNLAPSSAKKKVYIIDEVHMLTTEAFNALLKTIEEPPAHVVFIFCTTEPQKVPATIVSRCFHISLTRATADEIVHSLRRIADGEKLTVSDDVLRQIAQMADGGFRDGTKIFEELVLLSNGKEITKELVEKKLNVSGISYFVSRMVEGLEKRSVHDCLHIVQELTRQGTDIKYFIAELLSAFHELLLVYAGVAENTKDPNTRLSLEDMQQLVHLFSKAYQDTRFAVIPQLPLELAIVEWCSEEGAMSPKGEDEINSGHPGEAVASIGSRSKDSIASPDSNRDPLQNDNKENVSTGSKVSLDDVQKKERNLKVQAIIKGSKEPKEAKEPKEEASHKQENLPHDASGNAVLMENIIYKVKPYNHSVAGVLRGCIIKLLDGEKIVFETPYKFHKERLEEIKTREILEKGVKEITGKNLLVMVELKTG